LKKWEGEEYMMLLLLKLKGILQDPLWCMNISPLSI
jgi:hypothetical protein